MDLDALAAALEEARAGDAAALAGFLKAAGWVDYSARRAELAAQVVVDDETGCWLWPEDQLTASGYGSFHGKAAHRISYEAHLGPIPPGMAIDHLCRRRSCIAPRHLEPVTTAENTRRAMAHRQAHPRERVHHGAKRWCAHGHAFDEANTGYDGRGRRYCWRCRAEWFKAHYKPTGRVMFHIDAPRWLAARDIVPGRGEGLLLTTFEVAVVWGVSTGAFAKWRQRNPGLLKAVRGGGGPGRPCLFDEAEARAILAYRTTEAWSRRPKAA